jgi:protein SMG6
LKIPRSYPLNLDGWKHLEILLGIGAMVNEGSRGQGSLTMKAVSEAAAESSDLDGSSAKKSGSAKLISDAPVTRIDDSPSPSIRLVAACLLEVEPEKERWRNIARDWYAAGIAEQPGTGKLHHHLGLLSREEEGEELRGVYHFVKRYFTIDFFDPRIPLIFSLFSMTTLHPFLTSRESILSIWSHAAQARRSVPDAKASDLFILLHGMLFTNIQLDDFQPTLARFIKRLEIEGAEEREWIMMGIINITSIMEYGRPGGVLRKVGCVG